MWQHESQRSGEGKKKRTPDKITARVMCRPLFAYTMFILCHAFSVSQSYFTGIEYSLGVGF